MKLFVTGLVFLSALGAFVWLGVVEGRVPVFGLQKIKSEGYTGECRVDDGVVHSIESMSAPLVFTIRSDKSPGVHLAVEFKRLAPDNFKVGVNVGLRGSYDPAKERFLATEVVTACPSKYEASKEVKVTSTEGVKGPR